MVAWCQFDSDIISMDALFKESVKKDDGFALGSHSTPSRVISVLLMDV